jgi:ribosomal protein S18 acetylase RimI-like enzyme
VTVTDSDIAYLLLNELSEDPLLKILGIRGIKDQLIPEYRDAGRIFCHRDSSGNLDGVLLLGELSRMTIIKFAISPTNFVSIAKSLSSPRSIKRLLGSMFFLLTFTPPSNALEISWIVVRRDKQGLGVGSQLISDARREFFKTRKSTLFVKTLTTTPQNVKFYENNGFTSCKEIRGRVILVTTKRGD